MAIRSAKDMVTEASAAVPAVTAEDAKSLFATGEVVFLDVREPGEWLAGRVPGAVHVPRGLLEFAADPTSSSFKRELSTDRPVVVYCAAGGRSALAARTLTEMGYDNVRNLVGGWAAWTAAGGAVES